MSRSRPLLRWEAHYGRPAVRCFADRPATVYAMFLEAVRRAPDRIAIIAGSERSSYERLKVQVENIATKLANRGLSKGDRLALMVDNGIPFIATTLAAALLGLILVPLNKRQRRPEIQYVLNDCTARMLIVDADCTANLPSASQVPALEDTLVVDESRLQESLYATLVSAPQSDDTRAVRSPPASDLAAPAFGNVQEEDPFCILYTSGTTGRAKGAVLTQLGVVHSVLHYEYGMNLGADETSLLAVPAAHVTGLVAIFLTMIRVAGCTVLMKAFKAREFLRLAAAHRITHTLIVPAMYNLCLLEPDFADHDLSAWRIGGFGGAPMPGSTIENLAAYLPHLQLVNVYGSTETTSPATMLTPGDHAHFDTVGTALTCTDLKITGDDGLEVSAGIKGELWIRGPMVSPGYWQNEEATNNAYIDGYWRSGDIGSRDSDGYVRIFDRKKDVINRGGYKIYSIDVENVLLASGAIAECAIVGRTDAILGERVHAFIVPRASGCDLNALRDFCATELSDYKIPESFTVLMEPLPRNANGKILKSVLRARLEVAGQPSSIPR